MDVSKSYGYRKPMFRHTYLILSSQPFLCLAGVRSHLSYAMSKFPHIQLCLLIEFPEFLLRNRRNQLGMRYLQHPHWIFLCTRVISVNLKWCTLRTPQEAPQSQRQKQQDTSDAKRHDLPRSSQFQRSRPGPVSPYSPVQVPFCTYARYMEESMASHPPMPSPAAARGKGPPRPPSLDQGLWNSQGPRLCHLG